MSILFHNFSWKVLSFFVAFGLWFIVMSSNSIEITKEVNLELDLPPNLVVASEVPERITFRLAGSKFFLRTLANSLETLHVDLTHAKPGPNYYRIEKEALNLPIGVKVLSISPSAINPKLEPMDRRSVPVQIDRRGELPNGYRLVSIQAMPKNIRIKGPRGTVEKISAIHSPPIDLSEIPANLRWEVALTPGVPNVTFDEEMEPKVVVEVEPTGSNFRIAGVPIKVDTKLKVQLKPEKVALYVSCPPQQIKSLTPDKVQVTVEFPETKPGTYVRELKIELPEGVRLVRVVPDKVQVRLE